MIPIKDIKPNVVLIDYEWYAFLSFVVIVILAMTFLGYKLYKNRKPNYKKMLIKKLKELNYNNPKEVAYSFEPLAKNLINESNIKLFEKIQKKLIAYKYKPNVPPISKDIIDDINEFIRLSNES